MKKLLLACGLVGLIAGANAQPASTAPAAHSEPHAMMHEKAPNPAEHAAYLQKTLQLSDDQTTKVKKIFEDSAKQRAALAEKYKPQFEAFHGDMNKLHEQTHSQLNGILTPKQQQAFDALHEKHHHFHQDGDAHDHGDTAPQ